MSKNIAIKIYEHPDKDEVCSKLCMGISPKDISEWLKDKYTEDIDKQFLLSEKSLSVFKKEYLDFYNIIREDLSKTKQNLLSPNEELKLEIQGSVTYQKSLEALANNEVDIKIVVKRLVAAIELRASQVFDLIQEDSRNTKIDRTLIEWFNTLLLVLEKYDTILNGAPDQINIQNNINIQVLDDHMNVVFDIIRNILARLDYDTSLQFIEEFSSAMKNLKPSPLPIVLPIENRLKEVNKLNNDIEVRLSNT